MQAMIAKHLQASGIQPGDTILFHSDMSCFFGQNPGRSKKQVATELLDGILAFLGEEGTLVVPTFTYAFCRGNPYNKAKTPSEVGYFSNLILTRPESVRSDHPIFSVAVIGKQIKQICDNTSNDAFDDNSVFSRLPTLNAKLVFWGANFREHSTFLHYVEQQAGVDYRFIKMFEGPIVEGENKRIEKYSFFVKPLDGSVVTDLKVMTEDLLEQGLLTRRATEFGDLEVIDTQPLCEFTLEKLRVNPRYMLAV